MRIIYVSGAMKDSDFNSYVKDAKFNINPSNQNFHYRFLKALGTATPVTALTLRPFAKGLFDINKLPEASSQDDNITFKYLADETGRLYKLFVREANIAKTLQNELKESDTVILVDSMKYALAKTALRLGKKNRIKVFGIITDNPRLLSNESSLYCRAITSLYKKYDGFIALSKGLNELANVGNKPTYIFHGFAEELPEIVKKEQKPYFFCCGALYERYGILNMIEAFKKLKTDYELLIAGHGPLISAIKAIEQQDQQIHYLGLLSKEQISDYEQNAALNINPRLFDAELDKYSVPSKVLEYLASGTPLLTTMHTTLHEEFVGEAIWIKNGSVDELRKAMELFLKLQTNDLKKKALLAKQKVLEHYGLKVQGQKIYEFLLANSSFSNN